MQGALPSEGGGEDRKLKIQDARLLLEKFGQRGRDLLEQKMDRLDSHAREWATWKFRGLDVRNALPNCTRRSDSRGSDELLASTIARRNGNIIQRESDRKEPLDTTDPAVLSGALACAGLMTLFRHRNQHYPVPS